MKFFKHCLLFCFILTIIACSPEREPRTVVVVSLDGLRWDYPSLYSMPNFDDISLSGVSAVMRPCYPASTYPNHYSIATGLYPEHHGIINNRFWDKAKDTLFSYTDTLTRNEPAYFKGEPIWDTAERQGVRAATVYWVGAGLQSPDSLKSYRLRWEDKGRLTFKERVDTALAMLRMPEPKAPRLLMLYMEQPDAAGHAYGAKSETTGAIVHYVDSMVGRLRAGLMALPNAKNIDFIVLSDHGMTDVSQERVLFLEDYVEDRWIKHSEGHSPTNILVAKGCADSVANALRSVPHISVWKKSEIPSSLHYAVDDNIGDVVVAPDLGWFFTSKPKTGANATLSSEDLRKRYTSKGEHGYYPYQADMQVPFCAIGPDFRKGYRSAGFKNIDVYNLIAHLLGIEPAHNDGNLVRVSDLLLLEK